MADRRGSLMPRHFGAGRHLIRASMSRQFEGEPGGAESVNSSGSASYPRGRFFAISRRRYCFLLHAGHTDNRESPDRHPSSIRDAEAATCEEIHHVDRPAIDEMWKMAMQPFVDVRHGI